MYSVLGLIPREKPAEIKTVRIVKRESGRRNKDRGLIKGRGGPEDGLGKLEEWEDMSDYSDTEPLNIPPPSEQQQQFTRTMSLPRNYGSRDINYRNRPYSQVALTKPSKSPEVSCYNPHSVYYIMLCLFALVIVHKCQSSKPHTSISVYSRKC